MFRTAATDKSAFRELLTKDHHGDAILPKAKDGQEAAPHFLSKVHKLNGRSVVQRNVTPRRGEDMALQKLHALLRMVEQIAGVGGWEWNTAQDVLIWSDELFRIFGREPDKWIPSLANFISCIHPGDRQWVQDAIAASVTRNDVIDIEFRIVRPDGAERIIHSRAELARDLAGKVIVMTGISLDITERRVTERSLERVNRALRTLSRGSGVVVHAASEAELLHEMCRVIVSAGGYRIAWIGNVEHNAAKTVEFIACAGEGADRLAPRLEVNWADVPSGRGTVGRAVRFGKPQISQDILADPSMAPWAAVAKEYGIGSAASLPLMNPSGVFAVLQICASEPRAFDADELRLLQDLADDLSHGVNAFRDRSRHAVIEQQWRASDAQLLERLRQANEHLEISNVRLEVLATTDALTGLPNRRTFDTTLMAEWLRSSRSQEPLSLLMIDIDYFKSYNDSFGHQRGDQCLRLIGATIQSALHRSGDTAARYGGEEFAMILPSTDAAGALEVAEQLRSAVLSLGLSRAKDNPTPVSVSIGVATAHPGRGMEPLSLFELADEALYSAKREGRNCVHSTKENPRPALPTKVALMSVG
jgi:diguanylate cyclase (GGDEF)-like protein/PAS domain S-box-containing protein